MCVLSGYDQYVPRVPVCEYPEKKLRHQRVEVPCRQRFFVPAQVSCFCLICGLPDLVQPFHVTYNNYFLLLFAYLVEFDL